MILSVLDSFGIKSTRPLTAYHHSFFFSVRLPTCGVLTCPYRAEVQFACGPNCGKPKGFIEKICQCRSKSPLTFRTCVCPGFECPRIENDTNWPCPCPFPEEDTGPDPKQLAAERSRLTENTSGFKVAVEKKKPYEGEMSFEEALKFFAEHPEFLPPSSTLSSQTLLIPDEYHSDCCCEDKELFHNLTSCPGDEPFVSERVKKLEEKNRKLQKKLDKKKKKKKKKDKKGEVCDKSSSCCSSSTSTST